MSKVSLVLLCLLAVPAWAGEAGSGAPDKPVVVREILVPFEDLNVLLPSQAGRVMLSRDQYDALVKKAAKTPEEPAAPHPAVLLSAEYTASVERQRSQWSGVLAIEVLNDGLYAVPLDLGGVGLRAATLDGHRAPLGRRDGGPLNLFVEGRGRHELKLDMVAPVETTSAKQVLHFRLPCPPAARLRLTVPGDVELKSGAAVASRVVDLPAGVTRFEILPTRGDTTLVMSLNSHLQRQQRAVVARSVFIDEVTQAYERLHATVYFEVLHAPVERFRFAVPEGFEVTEVTSPLLARWAVAEEAGRKVLDVRLREATVEPVVLNLSASRVPAQLAPWTLPRLEPLDVVGQAAVFGLLVEERLKAEAIAADGLIAIDTALLSRALPESVFHAEPGAPTLVPVIAYYAPQTTFSLSARFVKPPAKVTATTNTLLILDEQGHQVRGGLVLVPEAEKLFAFDFSTPPGWQMVSVTAADGQPLPFERFETAGGAARVRVSLPHGVPVGQDFRANFHALRTPPGWLRDWSTQSVEFPVFAVAGSARTASCIAVEARDDMSVRPEKLDRLTPLDEAAKQQYGLSGVPTSLAYRCESPDYKAVLQVERLRPRLVARTFSFVRVEPDALACHDEIIYSIDAARTRRLSLLLPESTPADLKIRGLDNVKLKEYAADKPAKGLRRWNIQLEEARSGQVRLAIDFEQPLKGQVVKQLPVPIVRADGVAYQSGLLAVEGSAELDVQVEATAARRVDVGELVDAEYQPDRRLLGAFGFAGDQAESKVAVRVTVARHPGYPLHAALVERAELSTLLAAEGTSVTSAAFKLRTKALFLEVALPPDSELWSADLTTPNGERRAIKPQREGESVLVSLPSGIGLTLCELRLVYQTPVSRVGWQGNIRLPAPSLLLRADRKAASTPVPLADMQWRVLVPSGYAVVRTNGTLVTDDVHGPDPAVLTVAKCVFMAAGGIIGPPRVPSFGCALESPPRPAYKSADQSLPTPYYLKDDVQYSPKSGPADREMDQTELTTETLRLGEKHQEAMDEGRRALEPAKEAAKAEARHAPVGGFGGTRRADRLKVQAALPKPAPGGVPAADPFAATKFPSAPPVSYPDAQLWGELAGRKKAADRRQSLEGVRSLQIDLQEEPITQGELVRFHSLGADPRLAMTLADRSRFAILGWAVALAVGLLGILRTNRSVLAKARFVVLVALAAAVLPMLVDHTELARVANMAFFAASLLVPYYLLAGLVKWLRSCCRGCCSCCRAAPAAGPTVAAILAVALSGLADRAAAEPPPSIKIGPYEVQIIAPAAPLVLPDDVILRPYDPKALKGVEEAKDVFVSYAKYAELWNRAYPDKKIETHKPPTDYALAGATYRSTLEGDEYLLLSGTLEINVYREGFVSIPLPLSGGILARADLDGKPARLGTAAVAPSQQPAQSQAPLTPTLSQREREPGSLAVLYLSGKGSHRLEFEVRMRLEHRGGWRVAEGAIPAAPATAVSLTVPQAHTEVRLGQVPDRPVHETENAGERIETAVGPGGGLSIQWRPKVAEGQVDESMTAHSLSTLDVQEDALRLGWQVQLEFRRGQRESFRVLVPDDCLVEKVEGANVRGWDLRTADGRHLLDVTLLKAARDSETLTVWLARRGAVGRGDMAAFAVPVVRVDGAALHDGRLVIRRSPMLSLRTVSTSGVTRTDMAIPAGATVDAQRSPLGLVPFQAYQFTSVPFSVQLAAEPVAVQATAQVQTLLRISEYERSLETQVTLTVRDRPIYQVELLIPDDLDLRHVSAPGDFQWAVTQRQGRRLLSVYLGAGREGRVLIHLRGTLGQPGPATEVPLPRLEVLDVERQQGDIAVQADPAFDLTPVGLENCEQVLLEQLYAWLNPQQRQVTRLAISYRRPVYSGTVRLSARKADVNCVTITNVRVTRQAVEETILLDFSVRNAGVREVVFLLPAGKEDPRIQVNMLRQKTIERVQTNDGPRLRVRLELQEEVMGELRVLASNDRALGEGENTAPIPVVETGRTDRQFVAVESAGRDEVLVDASQGLERLDSQSRQWQMLKDRLGGRVGQAYVVVPGNERPRLAFRTQTRQNIETVGARIGLAETTLVLDAHGAYRAQVVYQVDNTTEQFLQIQLPADAELWTARVAGEPVKPTQDPSGNDPRQVRIPLVKTAAGDRDYQVVLKYGGALPEPGHLGAVRFPLVRTVNVSVSLSHVFLHLPERQQWFNFGGTMRLVEQQQIESDRGSYNEQAAKRLLDQVRQGGEFAKVRAVQNLKTLIDESKSQSGRNSEGQDRTAMAFDEAQQELTRQQQMPAQAASGEDNRERLNDLYAKQKNSRARNVVQDLGGNWADASPPQAPAAQTKGNQFNADWFYANSLENPRYGTTGGGQKGEKHKAEEAKDAEPMSGKKRVRSQAESSSKPGEAGRSDAQPQFNAPIQQQGMPQGQASGQAGLGFGGRGQLGRAGAYRDTSAGNQAPAQSRDEGAVLRYQQRLAQQQAGQQPAVATDSFALPSAAGPPPPMSGPVPAPAQPQAPQAAVVGLTGPHATSADLVINREGGPVPAAAQPKPAAPPAAGLASLDVELPLPGDTRLYAFTTPRGDIDITAWTASGKLVRTLWRLLLALVAVGLAWLVLRAVRRGWCGWLGNRAGSTLLIVLGIPSVLLGVFPLLGLAALIGGVAVKTHRALAGRAAREQPVAVDAAKGGKTIELSGL